MKQLFKYIPYVFLVAVLIAFVPPAENGKLKVNGKLKNTHGTTIPNVFITVRDSLGTVVDTLRSNEKGKYRFDLEYQTTYSVQYSHPEYKSIFLEFHTEIPVKKAFFNYHFEPPQEIMITDSMEYNDRTFKKKPLTRITFQDYFDRFEIDRDMITQYLDAMVKPNYGVLILNGEVLDSAEAPAKNVQVLAENIGGEILDSTNTGDSGRYYLETPYQDSVNVRFKSPEHHETYFQVSTQVDSATLRKDVPLEKSVQLYRKTDTTINPAAFEKPAESIAFDPETKKFIPDPVVPKVFEQKLGQPVYKVIRLRGDLLADKTENLKSVTVKLMDGDSVLKEQVVTDPMKFDLTAPVDRNLKLVFESDSFHTQYVNIDSRVTGDRLETLDANITLWDKNTEANNAKAFDLPSNKYYYNNIKGEFESDPKTQEIFAEVLTSEPEVDAPLGHLPLEGKTRGTTEDGRGVVVPGTELVLYENGVEIARDTSDKKGNYNFDLKLNKNYRLAMNTKGFYPSFIDINTNVPEYKEDHNFKTMKAPIFLVDSNTEGIYNPIGFEQKPMASIAYTTESESFEDNDAVLAELQDLVTEIPPDWSPPADLTEDTVKTAENTFLSISGRINDANDKRIKKVGVFVKDKETDILVTDPVTSDNTGVYTIPNVPFDKDLTVSFFKDSTFHPTFIDLNTNTGGNYEIKKIEIPTLKLYSIQSSAINPAAFEQPALVMRYNNGAKLFEQDAQAKFQFDKLLLTPIAEALLSMNGRVRSDGGRYVKNAKVYLEKDGVVVDSTTTDGKGNYQMNVPYNNLYTMRFKEDKFHETFVNVDTRTGAAKEDLRREQFDAGTLTFYRKSNKKVDPFAFQAPAQAITYNTTTGKFRNIPTVQNNFAARVFKAEEEEEEMPALDDVLVEVDEFEAEEIEEEEADISEILNKYKERAEEQKANAAKEATVDYRNSLARAMQLQDTTDYSNLENVLLANQSINNVIFEQTSRKDQRAEKKAAAEAAAEASKRTTFIAEAVSRSLRKGISAGDIVSVDSIFIIVPPTRFDYGESTWGVRSVQEYDVKTGGTRMHYYKITTWLVFDYYYRDGKEIDEDEYLADIENFKKLANRQ